MKEAKSLTDLFKEGWKTFADGIGAYIGILAIGFLIEMLLVGPGIIILVIAMSTEKSPILITAFSVFGIGFILSCLASLWIQGSLIWAIDNVSRGGRIAVRQALAEGWNFLGSLFWVAILQGLIVLGGLILLIIPGIILAIYFSQTYYVVILEKKRGIDVLWRSKELVAGHFWHVVGVIIVVGLLAGVANQVAGILAYLVLTPFWMAILVYLYKDLRGLKGTKVD